MDIDERITSKIAAYANTYHEAAMPSRGDLEADGVDTFVDNMVDQMSERKVVLRAFQALGIGPEKELKSHVYTAFIAYQRRIEKHQRTPEVTDFSETSGIRRIFESFRGFADGHEELFERAEKFGCFVVERARQSELREAS